MGIVVSILAFYVRAGCDAKRVAAALTFLPPQPPSYQFIQKVSKPTEGSEASSSSAPEDVAVTTEAAQSFITYHDAHLLEYDTMTSKTPNVKVLGITTSRGERIAAFFFASDTADKTIIYSHGNATDIGEMFPFFVDLRKVLNVQVLAYDYSGYGCSSGSPSELNTYADIEAAYDYVKQHGGPGAKKIVLLGQSVGSGPSCYLISKEAREGRVGAEFCVCGAILHSPCTSLVRVLGQCAYVTLSCWDGFPNIDRIREFENHKEKKGDNKTYGCPVMVLHGRNDEVVPFSHGVDMHHATPKLLQRQPYWVDGAGHNDIFERDPREYFRRLRNFLTNL
eukprot:Rmarinus@m.13997